MGLNQYILYGGSIDWKDDQVRSAKFVEGLCADYRQKQNEAYLVPKTAQILLGMPVTDEEMKACKLELRPQKTVTVAADAGDTKSALIGCYYFYEK